MTQVTVHPEPIDQNASRSVSMESLRAYWEALKQLFSLPASRQGRFSQAYFELLADRDPDSLMRLIESNLLDRCDLTFAAEAAGRIEDAGLVVSSLLRISQHSSSLVREGAVYGLSNHLSQEVKRRLKELSKSDPSAGVREAAREALER